MSIKVKTEQSFLVVNLEGEIDHHNASKIRLELDKKISETDKKKLILNFEDVSFMDSSGIGLIIGRYKIMKNLKGEIYATNLSKELYRIFDISGLFRLIKHYDTVEQCKKTES